MLRLFIIIIIFEQPFLFTFFTTLQAAGLHCGINKNKKVEKGK